MGTKIVIAQAMGVHDTIGHDLVAMVVDDIVVCGAKPLVMTDYIACGKVIPERIADIVRGIAEGCMRRASRSLAARPPSTLASWARRLRRCGRRDRRGRGRPRCWARTRSQAGDVVIAMASSGLHSNGYSLVRSVVAHAGWALDTYAPELGRSLGEELLEPTRIYSKLVRGARGDRARLARVLARHRRRARGELRSRDAAGLAATVARDSWALPPIFSLIQDAGNVPWNDLESTLNLGVGMVAVVAAADVATVVEACGAAGVAAWVIGEVAVDAGRPTSPDVVRGAKGVDGGAVLLTGTYPCN